MSDRTAGLSEAWRSFRLRSDIHSHDTERVFEAGFLAAVSPVSVEQKRVTRTVEAFDGPKVVSGSPVGVEGEDERERITGAYRAGLQHGEESAEHRLAASPSSSTGGDEAIERIVREAWTAGAMERDTDWKAWWLAHRDSILTAARGSDSDDV